MIDILFEGIEVGIVDKALAGQLRTIPISKRNTCAADHQFAFDTDGHFLSIGIQEVNLCIADGSTNGEG